MTFSFPTLQISDTNKNRQPCKMDTKRSNSTRKRVRRRSHTRKIALDGIVNMAEARREIVSALQLHRSISSTPSPSNESSSSRLGKEDINGEGFNNMKTTVLSSHQQYYYALINESIPVPEPTWSTTAPAVLAVPPSGETVEFEWADNISSSSSSSYTWWWSFLNSLDGKNVLVENSMVYGRCSSGANLEAPCMDINGQNPFLDEWLNIVPTAEDSSELF